MALFFTLDRAARRHDIVITVSALPRQRRCLPPRGHCGGWSGSRSHLIRSRSKRAVAA